MSRSQKVTSAFRIAAKRREGWGYDSSRCLNYRKVTATCLLFLECVLILEVSSSKEGAGRCAQIWDTLMKCNPISIVGGLEGSHVALYHENVRVMQNTYTAPKVDASAMRMPFHRNAVSECTGKPPRLKSNTYLILAHLAGTMLGDCIPYAPAKSSCPS